MELNIQKDCQSLQVKQSINHDTNNSQATENNVKGYVGNEKFKGVGEINGETIKRIKVNIRVKTKNLGLGTE